MTNEEIGELLCAARQGDHEAWATLVDQLGGLVWSVTRSFRLDRPQAADISQTVWLRLVENLSRIKDPDRVGLWLMTTTRRECMRAIEKTSRAVTVDAVDIDVMVDTDAPTRAETQVLTSERSTMLWRCIGELDDPCRALLRAFLADPPPKYEDVAAAFDVAPGTIGPMRRRCLSLLRATAIGHYDHD